MSDKTGVKPSMILTTSTWQHVPSFSLMPVDNDCPYIECLYNPMEKILAIIGKTKKDTFHMITKVDESGFPIKLKTGATAENPYKKQRVSQESYTEYYIRDRKEIESFIKTFAINHEEFDYMLTLDFEPMSPPDAIAKGPTLLTARD